MVSQRETIKGSALAWSLMPLRTKSTFESKKKEGVSSMRLLAAHSKRFARDNLVLLLFLLRQNNNKHDQALRACMVTDAPSNKNVVFVNQRVTIFIKIFDFKRSTSMHV